jgi:hypothetical protein
VSRRTVLGVDLASASWASNGVAAITFDDRAIFAVEPGALSWPGGPLTPGALADALDAFARERGVSCIALDGPHAWRDPETPAGLPGVGRRSEWLCRTQGKTGVWPKTYPGNQRPWIEHCIDVFTALLAKPGVGLQERPGAQAGGYAVLEAYPTAVWRESGLAPLPAKQKKPQLTGFTRALREAFALPPFRTDSHDDLQAVAAALCAVGAAGGPVRATALGAPCRSIAHGAGTLRVEGCIWTARPR